MIITQSVWLLLFQNKLRGLQRHLHVCVLRFCVPVLILPVVFVQKIRPCSGSHATSLCGGASPSTWPAWSTSPWPCSTPLAMMEMRVRIFMLFFFSFVLQQMISFGLFFFPHGWRQNISFVHPANNILYVNPRMVGGSPRRNDPAWCASRHGVPLSLPLKTTQQVLKKTDFTQLEWPSPLLNLILLTHLSIRLPRLSRL